MDSYFVVRVSLPHQTLTFGPYLSLEEARSFMVSHLPNFMRAINTAKSITYKAQMVEIVLTQSGIEDIGVSMIIEETIN